MAFPSGFVWGAAAASYQIEGAVAEDGRGLSVWDMFCRKEGAIFAGHSGAVSCDHYHRWASDIELMGDLGFADAVVEFGRRENQLLGQWRRRGQ